MLFNSSWRSSFDWIEQNKEIAISFAIAQRVKPGRRFKKLKIVFNTVNEFVVEVLGMSRYGVLKAFCKLDLSAHLDGAISCWK